MADIKKGFGLNDTEVQFINDYFHAYEFKDVDIYEKCISTKNKTLKKKTTK